MASESKGGFEPAKAGGSTVVIEELTSDSLAQEPSETEKHATETEFQSVAFAPWIVTDPASKEKLRQWYGLQRFYRCNMAITQFCTGTWSLRYRCQSIPSLEHSQTMKNMFHSS